MLQVRGLSSGIVDSLLMAFDAASVGNRFSTFRKEQLVLKGTDVY